MPATFGGRALLDPNVLRMDCYDRGLPTEPWFGLANSYRHPLGEKPGTADLVMLRSELNRLSLTDAAGLTLEFRDQNNRSIAPKKLTVLSALAITPGAPNDPDAAVHLKVADRRFHLAKVPTDCAFNLKSADGTSYLTASLNGGSPWTWDQLCQRLWDDLRAAFGDLPAWPGLPFTPDGTPENFDFYGGFAWAALCLVLNRLACAVRYDPTIDPTTGTWTVVQLGADDAAAVAAIAALGGVRDWDDEPLDPVRAWRPEGVRVLFRRRPLPTDGSSPWWNVDIKLAVTTGVVVGTFVILVDDLTALGATGTPSNATACASRAAERAADWLRERQKWGNPKLKQWEGVRSEVRSILGKTVAEWSVEDRGRGVLTAIAARPTDFNLTVEEATGGGGSLTVCGSPEPFVECGSCDLTDHDVLLHVGVSSILFDPNTIEVTEVDACGGSGSGSGSSGSGGGSRALKIRVKGKTENIVVGKGDPILCNGCVIAETLVVLCYCSGVYTGHEIIVVECPGGSGSGGSGTA